MTTPTRPAWNHKEVIEAAAATVVEDVQEWANVSGCIGDDAPDEENFKQFRALVTIAILESSDAYQVGRYFEDFYGWPVDRTLITIIDRAFRQMKVLEPEFVHAWVMENNIRIKAKKGQGVRIRVGDAEFTAEVTGLIGREARAIIETIGKDPQTMIIPAEEIVEAWDIAPKPTNPRPPNPEKDSA